MFPFEVHKVDGLFQRMCCELKERYTRLMLVLLVLDAYVLCLRRGLDRS